MNKIESNNQTAGFQTLERSRNRAGTTMVEALIAMVIFAVFTTGACKLILSQRVLLDVSRDHYTAANIAKNRMELARTLNFEQLAGLNESAIAVDKNGVPTSMGGFSRTTTLSPLADNLYEFKVDVKVRNRKTLKFPDEGQVLNTYIADHPDGV